MKKFLSDVLVDCNLTVSGSTTLGAATGVTVANSDDSTKLATTAWVKNQGYVSTNTTYDLSVPSGTTDIRLASSGGVNDDVTISAAGASTVSRVSDSEIRITSTDTIDYVNSVSLVGSDLTFTGVGNGFAGTIDLSGITGSFNAEEVQTVYENIKNVSGSPIQKGTPLAVVPGQTSGNLSDVVPANASDSTLMPAVFIANEDLADQAEGLGVVYGNITGIDTSAFDSGTTVYVAPGGGWTDTKPTGTNLIQNLGVITKSHDTNGGGVVMGAGRSNDVPNIPNGYAWVGNGSGVATPTLLGTAAYESASTFALANHNHDNRYYTQTELDTEFNKYLRSDIPDSFNKLINSSLNITPEWGGGAINLKPSVAGGSTGIVFTSAQNINTDNGKDHGYLWWYDNNNNYSINPGSQENATVVLGIMNDSVENGMGDSAVVESSGNIFLNPGIDPTEGSQGGNSGPDFTRGKVYVGRAEQYYEVYHEGNFAAFSGDYNDLTNKPTLFSGDYADLTNKPTLFSGDYADLTNKPTLGTAASSASTDFVAVTGDTMSGNLSFADSNGNARLNIGNITGSSPYVAKIWTGNYHLTLQASGSSQGQIRFNTGTTTATERMRIQEGGNIGIGTTNPSAKLHVHHTSEEVLRIDSGTTGAIHFFENTTRRGILGYSNGTSISTAADAGDMVLRAESTNKLHLSTGSSVALTVDSSQNVGIGTTSPTQKLHVDGRVMIASSSLSPGIQFQDVGTTNAYIDLVNGSQRFDFKNDATTTMSLVLNTGNVGIGTTSPGRKLHVSAGNGDVAAKFENTSSNGTVLHLQTTGDNKSMYFQTDHIYVSSGAMHFGNDTGDLYLRPGASGNVGIDTTSPSYKLDVNGSTRSRARLTLDSNLYRQHISITRSGQGYYLTQSGNTALVEAIGSTDRFDIFGSLHVNTNGNVGIGTTAPSEKLHVAGNARVEGDITFVANKTATLGYNDATAADGGVVLESFDPSLFIGAFLDYTIYDDSKTNMRAGTLQLVFSASQLQFNEVSTMDIGDTSVCNLFAVDDGGIMRVIYDAPDPTFKIKYHVRTL